MKNRGLITALIGMPAAIVVWLTRDADQALLTWIGVTSVSLLYWNSELQKEITFLQNRLNNITNKDQR